MEVTLVCLQSSIGGRKQENTKQNTGRQARTTQAVHSWATVGVFFFSLHVIVVDIANCEQSSVSPAS